MSESPLRHIGIASPCSADWEKMSGDDRVRFCQLCQLSVYNLSGMSEREATALVQSKEGRLCVRFYRREDGTVLTKDCPVGLQARYRRRLVKIGGIAAAVTLMTVVGSFTIMQAQAETGGVRPEVLQGRPMIMGDIAVPPAPQPEPEQTPPTQPENDPEAPSQGRLIKGAVMGEMPAR